MSGRAAEQTVASWERQHAKINNPWPGKFPKLSEAERLRNACARWCRCLCQDSRFMVHFTNTFGQVFFDLLGIVRGRANAGRQKAEERLVVERGEGVLHIHNTLESHWFHVGYAGFAAGDLPILGPLRVSTVGDHAISLAAAPSGETAQTKETWCLQLPHDQAEGDWWDECMNVLEELPRTEEWHMQLHRLIDVFTQPNSTSSTTRLVVLPMGKSRRWWTGVSCMEKAASEAVPDLLDDSEEPEEGVEQPKDASPDRCQSDEELPSPSVERLGSYVLHSRLARACKRAAAGTRESCVACRAGGREALTYLLTYKEGKRGAKASYQITCDYHEPDVIGSSCGKSRRLACRKTRKVEQDTLESEYETIRFLLRWVRRGPCFPGSRADHQGMPRADFEDESTSGEEDGGSATGSVQTSHVPSSVAPSHAVRPEPCWVCGERHELEMCPMWQLALQESSLASRESLRPLGTVSQSGIAIPRNMMAMKDVPGDGNCLFHAIGREIANKFTKHVKLPGPDAMDGGSWRVWLLHYIQTTSDEIDGSSIAEWVAVATGQTVQQYVQRMASAGGSETWGGFLEAALIVHAWSRAIGTPIGCVFLSEENQGAKLMSWIGSYTAAHQIACVWSGDHWQRFRLKAPGWLRLRRAVEAN